MPATPLIAYAHVGRTFGTPEPLTRDALGDYFRGLHRTLGLTTVMITQDMTDT
jgi:ABC-type proline/glycine betaine transport system ATPase subunit